MPVRNFVVGLLSQKMHGTHIFHGLTGLSETITDEQLDRSRKVAQSIYLSVVQRIDWKRIMLEASIIHMKLNHPEYTHTCADCVHAALLTDDRNWTRDDEDGVSMPNLDEERSIDDWPAAVVEAVGYRR